MSDRRKNISQRYLSGRSKIIGFSGLSSDRHLYIAPGEVEPNLGYPGEKPIPIANNYYQLITIDNGTTYDRYWQQPPALTPGGISVYDEGFLVGTANSVSKINFVGAGVTATASGTISTITISTSARVSVGTEPPGGAAQGDLWWDSDIGELYVYYQDINSNQWVETSGGSETVTISDTPPPSPNYGDLWWDSDDGILYIYYTDIDGSQWVDVTGGILANLVNFWTINSTGINTTGNVGIGTTTATDRLTVSGNVNVTGVVTALGGYNLGIQSGGININTGVITAINFIGAGNTLVYNPTTKVVDISIQGGGGGTGAGTTWGVTSVGIHTLKKVGIGTTNPTDTLTVLGNVNVSGVVTSLGGFNIGIQSAGVNVNTGVITAINFVSAGSTFSYNASTKIVNIDINNASVIVSDNPPSSPQSGDLWWESDTGQLQIYYNDGSSSQWVNANGADTLVQIAGTAPSGTQSGDLWWDTESGNLFLYYTDVDSSQWISVSGNTGPTGAQGATGPTGAQEIGRAHV